MINIIKAKNRHYSDFGWLQTHRLFSFSNYFDPQNIQFGNLRVFNDDIVQPGGGFPAHKHEDMEIITIVMEGEMAHEDNMGNEQIIKAGEVQRMSAGTGVTHSEYNPTDSPVNFYQVWIFPEKKGLRPSYQQKKYPPSHWENQLLPLVSGQEKADSINLHSDATIYRCSLDRDKSTPLEVGSTRKIFIYLTEGELSIDSQKMEQKDQARIDTEDSLILKGKKRSDFILIDLPS